MFSVKISYIFIQNGIKWRKNLKTLALAAPCFARPREKQNESVSLPRQANRWLSGYDEQPSCLDL
jgi:hypothetical protein